MAIETFDLNDLIEMWLDPERRKLMSPQQIISLRRLVHSNKCPNCGDGVHPDSTYCGRCFSDLKKLNRVRYEMGGKGIVERLGPKTIEESRQKSIEESRRRRLRIIENLKNQLNQRAISYADANPDNPDSEKEFWNYILRESDKFRQAGAREEEINQIAQYALATHSNEKLALKKSVPVTKEAPYRRLVEEPRHVETKEEHEEELRQAREYIRKKIASLFPTE